MDQIVKLKDSFFGYLTPARRRRTIQPYTPTAPTQRLLGPNTEPRGKERAVIAGRISKKYLSPTDTKRNRVRPSKKIQLEDNDEEYIDSDEDTENATGRSKSVLPEDSVSQVAEDIEQVEDEEDEELKEEEEEYGEDDAGDEEEVEDDEEELNLNPEDEPEISTEAKVDSYLNDQTEFELRRREVEEKRGEWMDAEVALYERLSLRGYQPLLPELWHHDFSTCPANIFTHNDAETFLNSKSTDPSGQFRGECDAVAVECLTYVSSSNCCSYISYWPWWSSPRPYINQEAARKPHQEGTPELHKMV
jgi:hypothetical protein